MTTTVTAAVTLDEGRSRLVERRHASAPGPPPSRRAAFLADALCMFPAVIAALAFVLTFVIIGLSVVFVAFSGGGRGARRGRRAPSRPYRRAVGVAAGLVIIVIGVAVPALVLANNSDNQAEKAPGGVTLTASQERGRTIFARECATCHTLRAANSVGRVGPNLDQLHPPKALILDAIAKGRARGQGQMPTGLVDGQDAQDVASFVAAVAGR
jgi:mono/diheme cytochrome c family protein